MERQSKQEAAARTADCFAFLLPQEGGKPRIQLEFDQAELKFQQRLNRASMTAGYPDNGNPPLLTIMLQNEKSHMQVKLIVINGRARRSQKAFRKSLCNRKRMQTRGKH